jgi:hypothetical protein
MIRSVPSRGHFKEAHGKIWRAIFLAYEPPDLSAFRSFSVNWFEIDFAVMD